MSRGGSRSGIPHKKSLLASADMDRLGLNPIEMLKKVYDEAMTAYQAQRGLTDKTDSGPGYLSVAVRAASDLASFKHPKLSAIAIKDLSDESEQAKPMTTKEAIEIMKQDPFAVKTEDVITQMDSSIETPHLPDGEK